MLSSMASQTSVAPPVPAADMAVDRKGPEAGGEKRGHEDRGRDAVMGAADSLQGQASSSSQQERSVSSKVRRIMGLETWTAEQEPGADDEEEQPGAEEMALERKKQFEAVCPLLLETGEVLAVPTLARSQVQCSTRRLWLQGAESSCKRLRSRSWCRMTFPWLGRSTSGVSGLTTTPPVVPR